MSLASLAPFQRCALLSYPHYFNIGDHIIWLGIIDWLNRERQAPLRYTSTIYSYSGRVMMKKIGDGPIFFRGGGNLGDLWPDYQKFREEVITRYRTRKIIFLPQSIHFQRQDSLESAKKVFNAHPDLTIFARDRVSYDLARAHFTACRSILAPDACFLMDPMGVLPKMRGKKRDVLFLCRNDAELDPRFKPENWDSGRADVSDWRSMNLFSKQLQRLARRFPPFGALFCSRLFWPDLSAEFEPLAVARYRGAEYGPYNVLHERSWRLVLAGVEQLRRYRVVVTNRLHAHILCVMQGIPNVFLPNGYHKNRSFFETWTRPFPHCRYVDDPSKVSAAIDELLA